MAKRPTKQRTHSWAVYHIRGTPAQFVGIVYEQPNEQAAINRAIEEFEVPETSATGCSRGGGIDRLDDGTDARVARYRHWPLGEIRVHQISSLRQLEVCGIRLHPEKDGQHSNRPCLVRNYCRRTH
jgi:hypothetical protein